MAEETKEIIMEEEEEDGMDTAAEEPMPNSRPRLMITQMILENFKSYAGQRAIGPFHPSFSAVVGPNGSGKSNVIDALLFVFGKRAKQLRLHKVRELIHRSSSSMDEQPESATVTVHMQEIIDAEQEGDPPTVVPNSQVILSRTAKQDNSSSYKLNGKTTPFRQICSFLGTKGIDLDNNRFLILQGEVEMISMMPPKGKTEQDEGLLEYLEDIIGSGQFVEKTQEAAERLQQLTEVRQEKLNRVKAVEQEKDSLVGAKNEAQALLAKDRALRRQEHLLASIHLYDCTKQSEEQNETMGDMQSKLAECREKLAKTDAETEELLKLHSQQKQVHKKACVELKKTEEEFAEYERKDVKLREDIKHAKKSAKGYSDKVEENETKYNDAEAKRAQALENIPVLEKDIGDLKERKESEDDRLKELEKEAEEATLALRAQLEQTTEKLAPLLHEKMTNQAKLDTTEVQVQIVQEKTRQTREKLSNAEAELGSLDSYHTEKQAELEKARGNVDEIRARIEGVNKENQVLGEREVAVGKKRRELQAHCDHVRAALQSSRGSRSPTLKAIQQACRKGGELSNTGILGRLGDLATIPKEYDVAISTACGMLDHIVVQTTAGAQRCLAFLRKYNLGRANFIPLDRLQKGAHDRVVQTPEQAPRLMEMICPLRNNITPALFLAVGDTLVAPDLETATRWAYDHQKRWRVVTVDGKLIETAGTMSGGGKSVRKGGMRIRDAEEMIDDCDDEDLDAEKCRRLEEEAAKLQGELDQIRQRRRNLTEESRSLKAQLKKVETRLPRLEMEIQSCDTTRENLTSLIPKLRSQVDLSDEDEEKLQGLLKEVEKCRSDLKTSASKSAKLEKEEARLRKAILDVGGSTIKKQQDVCRKILQELKSTENSLKSAKVAIVSSEKAMKKAEQAVNHARQELEKCEKLLSQKEDEFQALQKDAIEVSEAFELVKSIEAEQRAALEGLGQKLDGNKRLKSELQCTEIEFVGQIDSIKKGLVELNSKIAHWSKEISKLVAAAENDAEFDDGELLEDGEGTDDESVEEETKLIEKNSSFPQYSDEVLAESDKQEVKEKIAILQSDRNEMAKNANMGAIAEYRKKEADYLARVSEMDEVSEQRNEVRKTYEELRRKRLEMFMGGFCEITLKLKEMYQMITQGGDAELELVDSLDPFSEGIVFSVRPPKKSWKNISNLSGGEKTLSSLALVFALHHFKPTPLYVMDEIDAALDFKNVSIVANYIKERTRDAQFIIISLRNNMFELADRLLGIHKVNNCSSSVAIDPYLFGVACQLNGSHTPALRNRTNSVSRATLTGVKTLERQFSAANSEAGASQASQQTDA